MNGSGWEIKKDGMKWMGEEMDKIEFEGGIMD